MHSSKADNYSTIFPSSEIRLPGYLSPENVKMKRCGYLLSLDTSGKTIASNLPLIHTLTEALHSPFLPYIDHCVARPRRNAAHSQIDFMEKDRLLNNKRPYFLQRLSLFSTLMEMHKGEIYLIYITNIRQPITLSSCFLG